MPNILANSEVELKQINRLLDKKVPSYRQAYSDRTAWLMSCLAELAYLRFNPLFSNDEHKQYFIDSIEKLVNRNENSSLLKLLDIVGYDHNKEKEILETDLSVLKMDLIKTFDTNGTQAILVSFDKFMVLSFRGTEATSIKDIKSDVKAMTTPCASGGRVHSGFKAAYEQISFDVEAALNEESFQNTPLFITGHSLGGALATIAAKKLSHKGGLAACYTFGSPRVGDENWIKNIKTPIYRLVNSADSVTMMPPNNEVIIIVSWVLQFIPRFGKLIRTYLLSKFGGYIHCGNMRYLTHCPSEQYEEVKLLYSVSIVHRIRRLIANGLSWKHLLGDHSMNIYRKKLTIIAEYRNK